MSNFEVAAITAKINEFKADENNKALVEGKSVEQILSIMVSHGKLSSIEAMEYKASVFGDKPLIGADDVFQAQSNSVQSFQNRFDENSPMHKIVEGINAVQEKYAGMSEDEQVLASMELQKNMQKTFKELEKNKSIPKEWLDNLKNDFKDVNDTKSFLRAVFNRIDKGSDAIDSITWDLIKPSGDNIENDFLRGAYGFVDDLFSTKGVMSMMSIALTLGVGSEVAMAKGVTEATVKTVLQSGFTGLGIGQAGMGVYGATTADTPEEMEQAGYETAAGTFVATTAMAAPKIAKGISKAKSFIKEGVKQVKGKLEGTAPKQQNVQTSQIQQEPGQQATQTKESTPIEEKPVNSQVSEEITDYNYQQRAYDAKSIEDMATHKGTFKEGKDFARKIEGQAGYETETYTNKRVGDKNSGWGRISEIKFEYKDGRRVTGTFTDEYGSPHSIEYYNYDANGRLIEVKISDYDRMTNTYRKPHIYQSFKYNSKNQVIEDYHSAYGTKNFEYDSQSGKVTSITERNNPAPTKASKTKQNT